MKSEANRDSVPIYSQEEIKQNAVNGFLAFQKGCRQSKRKLFFRKGVLLFFLILLVGLGFSLWQIWSIDRKIPSTMYVKKEPTLSCSLMFLPQEKSWQYREWAKVTFPREVLPLI